MSSSFGSASGGAAHSLPSFTNQANYIQVDLSTTEIIHKLAMYGDLMLFVA
jgi:hypothetical protein